MPATAQEQLLMELVNRARLDPNAEAARLGITLNEGLAPGTISGASKQVLAGTESLIQAARGHSVYMLAVDNFQHEGIGDGTPSSRMTANGYVFAGPSWGSGENIAGAWSSGALDLTATTVQLYEALFIDEDVDGRGHRVNILKAEFREMGNGVATGDYQGQNAVAITQNFAYSGLNYFITGVTINDTDQDNFYDIGEARGSVSVVAQRSGSTVGSTTSEAAGGYSMGFTLGGDVTVTFSGGGLPASVSATILGFTQNVKIDLLNTNKILSSDSTQLGTGAVSLLLLGTDNLDGFGNALANQITGNSGINTLEGGEGNDTLDGASGADIMRGGLDSDFYYVDNVGDQVIEIVGQGTDTVYARTSYALGAGQSVEVLATSRQAATTAINLTGNELGQTVRGNAGNNILDGRGGIDQMYGFAGNDTYYVDRAADGVFEVAGQGSDTVYARVSYALAAGQSIELLATYKQAGTEAIHLTGNELVQHVKGNAGNNLINGGRGSDTLTGGLGFDTFVFDTALNSSTNVDTITDFSVPQDSIRLENAIFTALSTTGTLAASAFHVGSAATDSLDRIIYNSSNGRLYYDADGNGAGGMSHFATLSTGLAMTNLDFVVV